MGWDGMLIQAGQELSFGTDLVASRPGSVIRVTFAVCQVLEDSPSVGSRDRAASVPTVITRTATPTKSTRPFAAAIAGTRQEPF